MIGGNLKAMLQVKSTIKNEIGEGIPVWHDVIELPGWIDLASGDSKRTEYNAKIQESTHVFVGDYKPIPATITIDDAIVRVVAENARLIVNSQVYDVMLIDDPMQLHAQLEIYLQYRGGQDASTI